MINDITSSVRRFSKILKRLRHENSGLAMVEFAVSLPFFMTLSIGGVEIANYGQTIMQVNQIALHAADNGSRMGANTTLAAKQIAEIDINDVFTGARHEGRGIVLEGFYLWTDPGTGKIVSRGNARIFLSSIEPVANPNPTNRFRMRWQRCSGPGVHFTQVFGTPATVTNVTGVGPAGRQTIAPPNGATMFAEVHYHYRPMLFSGFSDMTERDIMAIASMVVRDQRDFTQIYNNEGVTPSTCP
jgi:Flp pilus assembly protein TadG